MSQDLPENFFTLSIAISVSWNIY